MQWLIKRPCYECGRLSRYFLTRRLLLWVKMISKGYQGLNIPEVLVEASFNHKSYIRRSGMSYLKADLKLNLLKYN